MTNLPKFGEIDDLICPSCGNQFLHHTAVIIYSRKQEDDRAFVVTKVHALFGTVTQTAELADNSRNPSGRRHGMAIEFGCECCGALNELTVSQHKGHTYLNWRASEFPTKTVAKLVKS